MDEFKTPCSKQFFRKFENNRVFTVIKEKEEEKDQIIYFFYKRHIKSS